MITLANKLTAATLLSMLAISVSTVAITSVEVDPATANMQKMHEQMSAIHTTKDLKKT